MNSALETIEESMGPASSHPAILLDYTPGSAHTAVIAIIVCHNNVMMWSRTDTHSNKARWWFPLVLVPHPV